MILVVDDTPANIDILMELLSEIDDVAVALDGEEALEVVEDEQPDLILLDIVMPGMNGFEVCQKLKETDSTKDIPVIFLSGNGSDEEIQKGKDLGAVDFLTKPIDPDLVVRKVREFIK